MTARAQVLEQANAAPFSLDCAPGERAVVPCSFWELKELHWLHVRFEPISVALESTPLYFEQCGDDVGTGGQRLLQRIDVAPRTPGDVPS